MVWLHVALVLVRELVRAAAAPLRVLLYLPFRHHWRRVAREVLDGVAHGDGSDDDPARSLATFLAQRRPRRPGRPHVFVSAGEASGEAHAARLVQALGPGVRVTAFGGAPLAAAGADVRFQLSEHAVMGVVGVLKQLPLILRAFATFLRQLRDDPPDLVVLVDYPGLHVVMAKAARRAHVPVLHYVAPQYWAWGPWRMRRYRRAVDATLTILPFETAFFARFRVPASYIGHPLLDELAAHPPAADAVAAVRARRTLVLMPGSRRAEIEANLPGMLAVARALRAREPGLRVVLPHKNPRRTVLLRERLAAHDAGFVEHHEGELAPWLAGARLVLVKSGTGSLEACLHEAPTIVVYRLRGMLGTLGYHNILSVPWIAAANLIAGRAVVPEHCFHGEHGWAEVQRDAERLWFDEAARATMQRDLAEVRRRLGAPGATARVAAIVRKFLEGQEP
ncbi:MAG: lipid-A-disaccharide synthase [Planctomycetes bacterium]|nr:lipid-A-disaccharide synthase [Planctomycetota bacterium]